VEIPIESWSDVRRWRRQQRQRLVADRLALSPQHRQRLTAVIVERLTALRIGDAGDCVAFYWPMRGEPDLRPFVRSLIERGAGVALPVVVAERRPLEFWRWDVRSRMRRQAVWDIPVPAERVPADPQVLLIPLIGFDRRCHRLGHGGGYYDRTLASLEPRPLAIGVGFGHGSLDTIYPQPHDVPMDLIVTEEHTLRREPVP
jgi:5-formyltetrahydrofolate cyclo-ligase